MQREGVVLKSCHISARWGKKPPQFHWRIAFSLFLKFIMDLTINEFRVDHVLPTVQNPSVLEIL